MRVHPIKLEHIHSNLRRSIISKRALLREPRERAQFSLPRAPAQMRAAIDDRGTLSGTLESVSMDGWIDDERVIQLCVQMSLANCPEIREIADGGRDAGSDFISVR